PLASVITSISRDHWQQLGPTLGHIATEKAGILKPQCPAIIGPLPPEAEIAVAQRISQLNCPAYWVQPATPLDAHTLQYQPSLASPLSSSPAPSTPYSSLTYSIPLLGDHQRINSALAIATGNVLKSQGWAISSDQIRAGLAKTIWAGRLQWVQWRGMKMLVDGAHNQGSAAALRRYVNELPQPIYWVMGMLKTKDHEAIFRELLREGDRLALVPVPDPTSAQPQDLAYVAQNCCPNLQDCQTYPDIWGLLDQLASRSSSLSAPSGLNAGHNPSGGTIVLCGSLYLIGYIFGSLLPANI
ncbi:MAG: bifunctional folylpolyglutamate synthase/dihydrofolate synthase, partial [Cyanothece sp. SIO2G6]|nr:bifunctional folylpolyglutamate synthase/dihydrofolate synthase [Cyanothece sp. SIO2G6]